MALIKCTECGHMISDKAERCPKCGCPTKNATFLHQEDAPSNVTPVYDEEENHSNKWLYVVIAVLLAALAGGWYCLFEKNNRVVEEDNQQRTIDDSTVVIAETTSDENSQIAKKQGIKVEGYKVIGNSEDLNLRLCVNVDGRLVKSDIGNGQYIVEVLDEHDYDDDGRNECLFYHSMGGAAPDGYSIAYFNTATETIDEVDFDCYKEPTPVKQNGKWYIAVKEGINTKMFVFANGELKKVADQDKRTSKAQKTYSFVSVFGMEELDEQEKTVHEYFDMDGDGAMETLEFYANQSHIWDWGRAMALNIHWNNGRQIETNMTATKISILSSMSNGLYDLLFEDKYLFKWNGKEYVEMK